MLLGDLNGDGRLEMLLVQADGGIDDRYVPHQVCCLTAFDLEGTLLWQVGTPDPDAVKAVTGCPIKFASLGEKLDALEPFHPERMASRILGMGDMLSLVYRCYPS